MVYKGIKEWGSLLFLLTKNCCIDCYVELWRSVVKIVPWNMITALQSLQLQIVWNWLGVLVLFGRLTAIGSIFFLRTIKVRINSKSGSGKVIFVCVHSSVCYGFSCRKPKLEVVFRISMFFGQCYDNRQSMSIFDRHTNSRSIVLHSETCCTQAQIKTFSWLIVIMRTLFLHLLAMMI